MKWLGLMAGGVAGTFARYCLSTGMTRLFGANFPYGTFAVNLIGCGIIGFLAALPEDKMPFGPDGRLLLMAGFCGAFTTFSAFMLETSDLLKSGQTFTAFLNIAASVVLGFLIFRLGFRFGTSL